MLPKASLFVLLGAVLLAALFVLLRPSPPAGPPAAPAPRAAEAAAAVAPGPAEPGPRRFELVVRGGRLESGPGVIRAAAGEELLLRVTADRADELHLHGYDLSLALVPGVPAELRFVASRAGRFEYELHAAHAAIGALEVHPR